MTLNIFIKFRKINGNNITAINNTTRLFVGVVNTNGIDMQTDQKGAFRLRPAANVAKATIIWNSTSSFFGLQGQNFSISNNDSFVHSLSYLVEQ